jgi:hypothetical protein
MKQKGKILLVDLLDQLSLSRALLGVALPLIAKLKPEAVDSSLAIPCTDVPPFYIYQLQ